MIQQAAGLIVTAVMLSGCGGDGSGNSATAPPAMPTAYSYRIPPDVGDGLATASATDAGMDTTTVTALVNAILDGTFVNIHSVLLLRDGQLVLEEYFPGTMATGPVQRFNRNTLHELHSVTKSVNSALVGIAIGQQLIAGTEQRVVDLLPQHADLFDDPRKLELTLAHLLTMTAGFGWDEWTWPYDDPRNDHTTMNLAPDQIRYVLGLPLADDPGTRFVYNSGVSICLGGIVTSAAGMAADAYAEEYLFRPLGITDYSWWRYASGAVQTGGGLSLRPRDMAKIGQLYLDGGRWGQQQVVPEAWAQASLTRQGVDQSDSYDYGYQWWLSTLSVNGQGIPTASAQGRGGQYIFIVPSLDLVAVFTGWNDNADASQPVDMMRAYLLPAAL